MRHVAAREIPLGWPLLLIPVLLLARIGDLEIFMEEMVFYY